MSDIECIQSGATITTVYFQNIFTSPKGNPVPWVTFTMSFTTAKPSGGRYRVNAPCQVPKIKQKSYMRRGSMSKILKFFTMGVSIVVVPPYPWGIRSKTPSGGVTPCIVPNPIYSVFPPIYTSLMKFNL